MWFATEISGLLFNRYLHVTSFILNIVACFWASSLHHCLAPPLTVFSWFHFPFVAAVQALSHGPNLGIEPESTALAGGFLTTESAGKPIYLAFIGPQALCQKCTSPRNSFRHIEDSLHFTFFLAILLSPQSHPPSCRRLSVLPSRPQYGALSSPLTLTLGIPSTTLWCWIYCFLGSMTFSLLFYSLQWSASSSSFPKEKMHGRNFTGCSVFEDLLLRHYAWMMVWEVS